MPHYSYSTEHCTGEIISAFASSVCWYAETGWGYYDETYIFIYGYPTEQAGYEAMIEYSNTQR